MTVRHLIFEVSLLLKMFLSVIRDPLIIGSLIITPICIRLISGGPNLLVITLLMVLPDLIPIVAISLISPLSVPSLTLDHWFSILYGFLYPGRGFVCVLDWLARAHDDRLYLIAAHLLKVCGIISADLNCFSSDYTLLSSEVIIIKLRIIGILSY